MASQSDVGALRVASVKIRVVDEEMHESTIMRYGDIERGESMVGSRSGLQADAVAVLQEAEMA
jgi:hypothetical protein